MNDKQNKVSQPKKLSFGKKLLQNVFFRKKKKIQYETKNENKNNAFENKNNAFENNDLTAKSGFDKMSSRKISAKSKTKKSTTKENKTRKANTQKNKIVKSMTIGEILEKCPASAIIMASYGLHCVGCAISTSESLEDGCKSHMVSDDDIDKLVKDINDEIQKND